VQLKLISLLGLVVFVGIAWMLSTHRRLFPWRAALWGLGLQFTFAVLILKTPWGAALFEFAGRAITRLIQFSNEGCQFVFGPLAVDETM
jgi:CNT family concentrative nucleoside transporter